MQFLAAIRALHVGHILHETDYGNIHQLRHVQRLLDDHGNQLLRSSYDDNTVQRERLEHSKRNVAGSRRHIHKHKVHVVPNNVRPELFNSARDHRAAPNNGTGFILEKEIHRHHLDSGFRLKRDQTVSIAENVAACAECLRNRRSGNIRIKHADTEITAAHQNGHHRRDDGFTHATLSADNSDHVTHGALRIQGFLFNLALISRRAVRSTRGTVMGTFFCH